MSLHPQHGWGIILQQAWMLRLKDRLNDKSFDRNGNQKMREGVKGTRKLVGNTMQGAVHTVSIASSSINVLYA